MSDEGFRTIPGTIVEIEAPPIGGFSVRFKGHLCAAIKTGFARKFILLRRHKGEEAFVSPIKVFLESERPGTGPEDWDRLARLECARAIKRTEWARLKLRGDNFLRGVASVERLLRDYPDKRRPGHGKRWKIVEVRA